MVTSSSVSSKIRLQSIFFCLTTAVIAILLLVGMGCIFKLSTVHATPLLEPAVVDFAVGVYTDVISLDSALTGWDSNSTLIVSQIYDTLTTYQLGGQFPQPSLAVSWTVTDDITWTFYLREGVNFHDGTPLDADAVVFNFERWWDPANPYHDGSFDYFGAMFGGFKGDAGCILADVSAVGSYQVQLVLTQAHYPLPAFLGMPFFAIASPAAIQAGTLPDVPVGSGAFSFVDHTPGVSILLAANPDYWGGAPLVNTLSFQIIPDDADRFAALQAGSIQSAGDLPDEYALLAADDPQLQIHWRESSGIGYLGINTAHTPLDNLLVRQAIAHAIDLPALVDNYYTAGDQVATQFLPPTIWGRDPDLSAYSYDPELSLSLLATAGYTEGFTTTLAYRNVWRQYLPDPSAVINAISTYLGAVGIQAQVIEYESSEFIQKWYDGELDLYLLGWYADYLHPDNFFSPLLCDPDNLGFGPLDGTLCDLVQNARAESDPEVQLAAYQAASQRVYDNLPLLPIVNPRNTLLLGYNVTGVQASIMGMESYKDAFITGAEQIIVDPEVEASLVYVGEDLLTTTLELPAGAVSETILLRFVVTETSSAPEGYVSAGKGFGLSAIDFGETLPGFTFQKPVTVTIYYSDADVANVHEETLLLFYWAGGEWLDAATTCTPNSTYQRDPGANRISLPICHLSTFGLFAEPQIRQFLPFVTRK